MKKEITQRDLAIEQDDKSAFEDRQVNPRFGIWWDQMDWKIMRLETKALAKEQEPSFFRWMHPERLN